MVNDTCCQSGPFIPATSCVCMKQHQPVFMKKKIKTKQSGKHLESRDDDNDDDDNNNHDNNDDTE